MQGVANRTPILRNASFCQCTLTQFPSPLFGAVDIPRWLRAIRVCGPAERRPAPVLRERAWICGPAVLAIRIQRFC